MSLAAVVTLLQTALLLLTLAQGPNVPPSLKTQATSVANQAIAAATQALAATGKTPTLVTTPTYTPSPSSPPSSSPGRTPTPTPIAPSASPLSTTEIYVSPSGNDANVGTISAPLATIQKAQEKVRILRLSSTGNIIVYLRGGTYALTAPLTFTAVDGGTNNVKVTYTSYPGESAIISGGKLISDWTQASGTGFWYSYLGNIASRDLYASADSPPLLPGRYPAGGTYFKVTGYTFSGSCAGTTNPSGRGALKSITLQTPTSVPAPYVVDALNSSELVILKTFAMTRLKASQVIITGPNELTVFPDATAGLLEGCSYISGHPSQWPDGFRAYFESNPEFFANPTDFAPAKGSFTLANSSVYFNARATDGSPPRSIVVPVLEKLIVIAGTNASPVKNLSFDRLQFRHTSWNYPRANGYIGGQSGFSSFCVSRPCDPSPMISITNADNVSISNSTIAQSGGAGIYIDEYTQSISISNNVIQDTAGNGITAGRFYASATGAPTNINISNNKIRSIGRRYEGVGVLLGYLTNSTVSHNDISDAAYTGISSGWFSMDSLGPVNNTISFNNIYNVNTLFSDGAGIYLMQGSVGTHVDHNYIHDITASENGFATNLRAGLYLDNAASGVIATLNQISNVSSGLFLQDDPTALAKNNSIKGLTLSNVASPFFRNTYDSSNVVQYTQGVNQEVINEAGVR